MKVLFDPSVLVAAVVDQLPQHPSALECFVEHSKGEFEGCCSAHALAECYATLTALPLARRVQPLEAKQLIVGNFVERLTILDLPADGYVTALDRVARLGLRSGVIYDAVHLASAEAAGCERLYTFNLRDFERLAPTALRIVAP